LGLATVGEGKTACRSRSGPSAAPWPPLWLESSSEARYLPTIVDPGSAKMLLTPCIAASRATKCPTAGPRSPAACRRDHSDSNARILEKTVILLALCSLPLGEATINANAAERRLQSSTSSPASSHDDVGSIIAIAIGSTLAVALMIAMGIWLARRHFRNPSSRPLLTATGGAPLKTGNEGSSNGRNDDPVVVVVKNDLLARNTLRDTAAAPTGSVLAGPPSPNLSRSRAMHKSHVQVVVKYKPQTRAGGLGPRAVNAHRSGAQLQRVARAAIEEESESMSTERPPNGGEREEVPKPLSSPGKSG
jgi:hypothetical protein